MPIRKKGHLTFFLFPMVSIFSSFFAPHLSTTMDTFKRNFAIKCYHATLSKIVRQNMPMMLFSVLPPNVSVIIHNHRQVNLAIVTQQQIDSTIGYGQTAEKDARLTSILMMGQFNFLGRADDDLWRAYLYVNPDRTMDPFVPTKIANEPWCQQRYYAFQFSYLAAKERLGMLYGTKKITDSVITEIFLYLDHSADVQIRDGWVLRFVASNGTLEQVRKVVEVYGADINTTSDDDCALWRACRLGRLEICKFLLEKGANVHIADERCFRIAKQHRHVEILNTLYAYQKRPLYESTLEFFQYIDEHAST